MHRPPPSLMDISIDSKRTPPQIPNPRFGVDSTMTMDVCGVTTVDPLPPVPAVHFGLCEP